VKQKFRTGYLKMCLPDVKIFFRFIDAPFSIKKMDDAVKASVEFGKNNQYLGVFVVVPGKILTHYEETVKFFRHSAVGKAATYLQDKSLESFGARLGTTQIDETIKDKILYAAVFSRICITKNTKQLK
jgi:hypothetical protein